MCQPLVLLAIALIRALGTFRTAELVQAVGTVDLSDEGRRDLAAFLRVLADQLASTVPAQKPAAALRGERVN